MATACSKIWRAIRFVFDPPGLRYSNLANIVSQAPVMRESSTSAVQPIASTTDDNRRPLFVLSVALASVFA